ncbi:hypothetical protein DMO17_17015 [Aquipseudomonas alcaligenes]|uniref:Uncharacterized protein n=1 Tax=Aquipseudomonas alcaligenes TaxID=43263 RepID=A0A2V4KHH3_AQUAC|nr:hypothetical protein DMO17_17015 [Pseudomonas alcaligenes]
MQLDCKNAASRADGSAGRLGLVRLAHLWCGAAGRGGLCCEVAIGSGTALAIQWCVFSIDCLVMGRCKGPEMILGVDTNN